VLLNSKQIKVGLTGSIGAGKTLISSIFEKLGMPIFNSDIIAKKCMQEDNILIHKIKQLIGEGVYKNGELQRNFLAEIIFNNKEKLFSLNQLVHPVVYQHYIKWCEMQKSKIVIKEAAILFESGLSNVLDKVICVSANKETRIHRVMMRDNCSRDQVLNKMSQQMTQSEKEKLSDFIIINDNEKLIIPQILDIITKIS
jgi:dephospho-CoA kinase